MGGMFPSSQDLILIAPVSQTATIDVVTGVTTYGSATVDGVSFFVYRPDGSAYAGPVAGVLSGASGKYTVPLADAVAGQWTFGAAFTNLGSPVVELPQIRGSVQWGGWVDNLNNAATQCLPGGDVYDRVDAINVTTGPGGYLLTSAQNADSQSYRIQQTVQGNSTWDHTTGTVGITSTGESFQLADEAGTPVGDQKLAVRRVNSTLG